MNAIDRVLAAGVLALISAGAAGDDCRRAQQLFEQAQAANALGEAEQLARQSLAVCPSFQAWYLVGRACQERRDESCALEAYAQADAAAGSHPRERALALGRRGEVLAGLGRETGAVAAFAQAEALVGSDGALLEPGGPLSFLNAARQRLAQWQSRTDLVSSAEIVRALRGGVALRPAIHLRVSFDFDQASLNARGLDQVERLRAALRDPALSDECFRIIGHTDVRGSDAYNDALSLRRAETVRRVVDTSPALVGRLRVEGHGKRELLRKGTTEEDHRINRRVEVRVIACGRS